MNTCKDDEDWDRRLLNKILEYEFREISYTPAITMDHIVLDSGEELFKSTDEEPVKHSKRKKTTKSLWKVPKGKRLTKSLWNVPSTKGLKKRL
jgi:hypothetical protein